MASKSQYVNSFYPNASKIDIINIIDDFYKYDSLKHFIKKNVDSSMQQSTLIDWRQRFRSTNYMEMIMSEYLNYVKVLKKIQGVKRKLTKKENETLQEFYRRNNWRSLFKNIAKARRLKGDVYVYWFIDSDNIPRLQLLPSKYVEIQTDADGDITSYTYKKTIEYQEKISKQLPNFVTKTKAITVLFERGKVTIYEDNMIKEVILNRVEYSDFIPVLHFQYLKEEDSNYSEIPCEPLIDLCLELDRIETDIGHINNVSGSPTLIVIDGMINEIHSGSGASAIMYIDTLKDRLQKGKQAKFGQLEITNALDSQYKERDEKLAMIFMKAHLIPPKMFEILARSDSGKVITNLRKSLEDELRDFYEEVAFKFKQIFKILLPNIKTDVTFEIPMEVIDTNLFDKMVLINGGMETLQNYLRDQGKSEEEIDAHIKELLVVKSLANSKDQIDPDYYGLTEEVKEPTDTIEFPRNVPSTPNLDITESIDTVTIDTLNTVVKLKDAINTIKDNLKGDGLIDSDEDDKEDDEDED